MDLNLEIFLVFFKISLMSVGGVFGMMPELERMIVHEHHWLTTEQFWQMYVVGQFVPGPTMAFCPLMGYSINGWGGFASGFFGIYAAPTILVIASYRIYSTYKNIAWVKKAELSLRPIVIGLLCASILRLWSVQTEFEQHGLVIKALTLFLMAAILYVFQRTKWDILILVFAFGLLWLGGVTLILSSPYQSLF